MTLSIISQSGQQNYLIGLESELSRMMYVKCLDRDQDKVIPKINGNYSVLKVNVLPDVFQLYVCMSVYVYVCVCIFI